MWNKATELKQIYFYGIDAFYPVYLWDRPGWMPGVTDEFPYCRKDEFKKWGNIFKLHLPHGCKLEQFPHNLPTSTVEIEYRGGL